MSRTCPFLAAACVLLLAGAAAAQPDAPGANDTAAPPAAAGADAEPDPARAPPKGKAVVWGVVSDDKTGEPLIEAQVTVEGAKLQTVTDLDGRYRLELPPGKYTLRFWAEVHKAQVLKGVNAVVGRVSRQDVKLVPDTSAVDVVEVETEADRAAVEGQILTRQRAAAVGDSVGRAEIAKTPDKNAAQAAQRVVGATVVGGRFVYVRGLGERYTNALINGAPLPSPEPDRAAVPLDLFPTIVLDSLTIAKTFTPDVPGDFAGGSVRVTTRRIPARFIFQSSLGAGYNTQSTFRQRLTYSGSSTDWLGFDSGTRALPSGFPGYKASVGANKPGGTVSKADVDAAGRSINSYFSTQRSFTPVDHNLSVAVGDGWKLGGERRLGVLAALGYGHSYEIRTGELENQYTVASDGGLSPNRLYKIDTGSDTVNWGAFGSIAYEFNRHHRLTLIGLHSQISDNTARVVQGFNSTRNATIHDTELEFVSRALNLAQLKGEHELPDLAGAELDWSAWLSNAARNQPDTRNATFARSIGNNTWTYVDDNFSGRHFWSDQSEKMLGGQLDWTQPVAHDSKLKFGGFLNRRKRDFTSRTMAFRRSDDLALSDFAKLSCPGTDFDACADSLFRGSNIGPVVRLSESTLPVDAYTADLNVYAGYLMADAEVLPWLRLIAGERLEVTRQDIKPFDQFNPDDAQPGGDIHSSDLLPTVAAVASTTKKSKLRVSVTRTIARPQLRELAPFAYSDYFGGRFVSGNPDLSLTHITNADLRFEYFPTLREVLATSVFYKHFKDPIETVAIASGDRGLITFQNADGADLYGVELEARKNLKFLSKHLSDFTAIANLTLAKSRITLVGAARTFLTNASRSMINQSPYVLNIALDYENQHGTTVRALYNVAGARIVQVGAQGLPDAYEHPRHDVDLLASQDLSKHFQVKLAAKNILNSRVLVTQGRTSHSDNVVARYTTGTILSVGATYTY